MPMRLGGIFPKLKTGQHLTGHFGLVSDFLSECWNKLRAGTRVNVLQGRVYWGGALSGRDIEAVNNTMSGLLKLLYPNPEMLVPDEDLEWMARLALESRRRFKEQQQRIFKSEFPQYAFQLHAGRCGRRAVRFDTGAA